MAVVDYNRLTSITRSFVMPQVVSQVIKDLPTFGHFLDKATKRTTGGTTIDVPVTYKFNPQGGSYSGLDVLDTSLENTRTRAVYNWKQVYQPIVISNMEHFQNGGKNASDEQIVNLIAQEMEEAKTSLKDKLATMMFGNGAGNGGKDLNGLQNSVDDGSVSASLGGITFADYSWWQANVETAVGSLTRAHMAAQYFAASSGSDKVNMIVTTETLWSAYEALLSPAVRYNYGAAAPKFDTPGLGDLFFRGAKLFADEYCAAGEMYFLNDKYIDLIVGDHPVHPTDGKGFTVTPMVQPHDQDGEVGFILFYAQLVSKRPNRQAKSTGLTA